MIDENIDYQAEEFADEPDEDSIMTDDHINFYQYGKLAFTVPEGDDCNRAIKAYMEEQKFWPNCFWVSDHGNAHLIEYWKED